MGLDSPDPNRGGYRYRNLKTSKALLKAKRSRAPAYSRALRRIKEGSFKGWP